MPSEEFEVRLSKLREKMDKKQSPRKQSNKFIKGVSNPIKNALIVIGVAGIIGTIGAGYFVKDYVLKRQDYPIRNVLFTSENVVKVAGGTETRGVINVDSESKSEIYQGGLHDSDSKISTYLFATSRETRGDLELFNMEDIQKLRIASAARKKEEVQAGARWNGSSTIKEQTAELILREGSKAPQKYYVYKFIPERGLKEIEVTIIENPDGSKKVENLMIEGRSWPLGWLVDKRFRSKTLLSDYVHLEKNTHYFRNLESLIQKLSSQDTMNRKVREKAINNFAALAEEIPKKPIYATYEDGIIDLLPQESTIYLAENPSKSKRFVHWLGFFRNNHNRLRVENHWDLWPGKIPILNRKHFSKGEDIWYPFDKYNNGGYTIKDKYGDIARIEIKDFLIFQGADVLYKYYFDLNGDGKITKKNELIGEVLCNLAHDEKINLKNLIGEGRSKLDISFRISYTFMSPDSNLDKGMELFNLCGYVESCMPNEINRGFGKHSILGLINQERSDIMLNANLNMENMSRSLTQESTLIAKYDIVNVLNTAKRPYTQDIAQAYGIEEYFEGQYKTSKLLKEKIQIGALPYLIAIPGTIGTSIYLLNKRKKKKKLELKQKLNAL